MTQAAVVTRLALRELWISFRLFGIVAAFVAGGSVLALLPAPLPETLVRLVAMLLLATAVTACVAAWSMAEERMAGRAGWLVTRSLPRGTLLVGWFLALATLTVLGLVVAGTLGWLTLSSIALRLEPDGYATLLAGVAATQLAAIALGLAAGSVLPAVPAAMVALLGGAVTLVAASLLPGDASLVPGAAFVALARLTEPGTAIGPGLRAAGVGLASTAVLLVMARLLLERAEL